MSLGVMEFLNLGSLNQWVVSVPIAILHAALDESGKFHDHDVISLCGWISTIDQWERFALKWQAVLDEIGISELHTAEFMALRGQYFHLRQIWGEQQEEKKNEALTNLCNVLRGTMGRGFGVTLDSKYYRSMPDGFKLAVHKSRNPNMISLMGVIEQAVQIADYFAKEHGLGDNVKVSMIFDQEEEQSVECLGLLNKIKKENEEVRNRVSGICFCDRRQYSPLQAADVIAYLTKKEMERRTKSPNEPVSKWFTMLSTSNRSVAPDGLFNARILDGPVLDELAHKMGWQGK